MVKHGFKMMDVVWARINHCLTCPYFGHMDAFGPTIHFLRDGMFGLDSV